jgi:type I restriction enzyme S subunit
VKLSDVATLSSGGTPSKANAAFWDGDIPWVSPKDMKFNHVVDAADKITRAAVSESAARIVGSNSVLVVVRSGILAHTFPVATLAREVSFNQDIKAITPKNGSLLPAFLFWMLKGQEAQILRIGVKKGATVHSLSNGFLESLRFPLPPLDDQRRIVGLLDRAAEIRRRADAARAKARAIIPALFLDMFGDPATNPKGWPMVTVGDLLQSAAYGTSQKANDRGEGIPMIRMGNVTTGGQLDTIDLKHIAISGLEREKAELLEGDLLFNRTNSKELVGKTGLWDGRFEAVAASYFIRLRVKCDLSIPSYLWAFFNTRYMKRALFDTARGAIGQANINAKELRAFRVAVPPFDLQEAFAEQVQRLEALARHLDAIAAKAETMAAGLSAEVFDAGERKASVDGSLASC